MKHIHKLLAATILLILKETCTNKIIKHLLTWREACILSNICMDKCYLTELYMDKINTSTESLINSSNQIFN
jgi:hypothetical protein